jgi:hypothetical protein
MAELWNHHGVRNCGRNRRNDNPVAGSRPRQREMLAPIVSYKPPS